MIATIEGILEHCGIGSVVIKVGGVGIQVYVPSLTLSRLGVIGDKVSLHTHLYVKEDNISLYGFASSEEVALFENLISISGIGPRIALALLSKLSAEQLATAIISGNVALIDQVPGIGKKLANRLIVELRDKLEREWKEAALPLAPEDSDAIAALTSLGYSLREVTQVVSSIPNSSELSLEEKVKTALQELASK